MAGCLPSTQRIARNVSGGIRTVPLIPGKGKEVISHNIAAEMHAGKPQDQAIAIAMSKAGKAKKKKKPKLRIGRQSYD